MNSLNYPKKGKLDFLAVMVGGSRLYGLENEESDWDARGVFLTNKPSVFVGLEGEDCVSETKEEGDDYIYFELVRFLQLLRKTNTNVVELLFAPNDAFLATSKPMELLRANREKLIDSHKLLQSTMGYVHSESRLALGERTGRLGGKRKAQLDKYGYSPKNVAQIIRIVNAVKIFMETGVYPVKVADMGSNVATLCLDIKNNPEKYSKDSAEYIIMKQEESIRSVVDKLGWKFDNRFAADVVMDCYFNKFK
jgi:predicted nucleotidyltransferase